MLHGIDVSNNNGDVNWKAWRKDFGIAKATEGLGFRDGYFGVNWHAMKSLGMLRGAYHFLRPGDAASQASYFVSYVRAYGLDTDDILALDVEDAAVSNSSVRTFVADTQRMTGKRVFLYGNYSFLGQGYFSGLYESNPFWIANPGGAAGSPQSVHPFPVWTIQQYSWEPLDQNIFNGNGATWKKLANIKEKPAVKTHVSDGTKNLDQLAVEFSTGSSSLLKLMIDNNPHKEFSAAESEWINSVFTGKTPATKPVPKGFKVFYKA